MNSKQVLEVKDSELLHTNLQVYLPWSHLFTFQGKKETKTEKQKQATPPTQTHKEGYLFTLQSVVTTSRSSFSLPINVIRAQKF